GPGREGEAVSGAERAHRPAGPGTRNPGATHHERARDALRGRGAGEVPARRWGVRRPANPDGATGQVGEEVRRPATRSVGAGGGSCTPLVGALKGRRRAESSQGSRSQEKRPVAWAPLTRRPSSPGATGATGPPGSP